MNANQNILNTKTVIIGAGMSGISSAINLLNNNYNDFLIFEAMERIGGRFCTVKTEGGYVELGAQWIHGQVGNPLFKIALENKLILEGSERIMQDTEKVTAKSNESFIHLDGLNKKNAFQDLTMDDPDETIFITQNGKKISTKFAQGIFDLLTKIITLAGTTLKPATNDKSIDNRVGDYLFDSFNEATEKEIDKYVNKRWDSESVLSKREIKELLYGLFLQRIKRENIRSGISNLFDLSLRNFSNYKEFEGNDYVELKNGYGPIVDVIISKQKAKFQERLHLNHYIKKIHLCLKLNSEKINIYDRKCKHCSYSNDPNKAVLIICNKTDASSPKDFVVICDNVISTMSLGYLKENINSFLEPISYISDEKRLAISRLGFGTINKIFLFYDKPFWSKNTKLINMVWIPTDVDHFQLDKIKHVNDSTPNWIEQLQRFQVVRSQPNCLMGWISGSEYFEKLDDQTIAKECTNLLRKFFGNDKIPEPKSVLRTKWNSNKYVRGSYSCMPIGSLPTDFQILAKPIPSVEIPIIRFAGEHTHPDYYSTMHAAYLTGIRESDNLLGKK